MTSVVSVKETGGKRQEEEKNIQAKKETNKKA